jgi:predicted site-specific integrase-resolvase
MPSYSTREAAQKLGLSLISLKRYVAAGKIPMPPVTKVGGVRVRLWSDSDIERVREILPKIANGRKTRYQKKHLAKPKTKKKKPQPRAAVPHEQPRNKKS